MKSRVHPKYKTRYHVGNWPAYDRALVQRGDVTLWLSADAIDAWKPEASGRPGGQRRFSDAAIETALTLRLVFRLPLRQTEGFVRSILALLQADLDAPDHTTLSRRAQQLSVELNCVPAGRPIHLVVDSTGLSIVGEGEWAAVRHGGRGQSGWRKLHLGVDAARIRRCPTPPDGPCLSPATAVERPGSDHSAGAGTRPPTMEEGVGLSSASARRERVLPVQADHRGRPASPQ